VKKTGVPAEVTMAQLILESSWGIWFMLLRKGILAVTIPLESKLFGSETVTHEIIKGKKVKIVYSFANYRSVEESIEQHGQFLMDNKRCSSLFKS